VPESDDEKIYVSATKNINIDLLKNTIAKKASVKQNTKVLVGDLLAKEDIVILVTPIDQSAPKGRLILPQQQTIRDILDSHCISVVCQVEQLDETLKSVSKPPKMVITDSQAFGKVSEIVPSDIPLTSFSILFARYKGDLITQVKGAAQLSKLKDGDKILISEGCTHHRQCGDIGTVKLPKWIKELSGSNIEFDFTSGGEFPKDLSQYKLVVHCGGCMLNETEMKSRLKRASEQNIPIVNYGMAIAYMNGILERSMEIFRGK
jgi:[FeFe] hydrogenase H-cluster maturation GTPase HydF